MAIPLEILAVEASELVLELVEGPVPPGVEGQSDDVRLHARARQERPAVFGHVPVHDGDRDRRLETLETPEDQRAVGPGTGMGDVQVIAARLRREAAFARGAGAAVGGDPVAELGILADELTVFRFQFEPVFL